MKSLSLAALCVAVALLGAGVSVQLWRQALAGEPATAVGAGLPADRQRSLLSSFLPPTSTGPRRHAAAHATRTSFVRVSPALLAPRRVPAARTSRPAPLRPRPIPRPTPSPEPAPAPKPSPPPAVSPPPATTPVAAPKVAVERTTASIGPDAGSSVVKRVTGNGSGAPPPGHASHPSHPDHPPHPPHPSHPETAGTPAAPAAAASSTPTAAPPTDSAGGNGHGQGGNGDHGQGNGGDRGNGHGQGR